MALWACLSLLRCRDEVQALRPIIRPPPFQSEMSASDRMKVPVPQGDFLPSFLRSFHHYFLLFFLPSFFSSFLPRFLPSSLLPSLPPSLPSLRSRIISFAILPRTLSVGRVESHLSREVNMTSITQLEMTAQASRGRGSTDAQVWFTEKVSAFHSS